MNKLFGLAIILVLAIEPLRVTADSGGGITVQVLSTSQVVSNPPDSVSYEKAIGFFTSTSYPSYFLATNQAAYIYDTNTGGVINVTYDGRHYERARTYYASPSDQYQSLIASAGDAPGQLVAYINPANSNGGDPYAPWTRLVINGNSGCHSLYVADLDGDGLPDVACSGTLGDGNPAFSMFQNSDGSWTDPVGTGITGDGIALVAVKGVNRGARTNIVGCNGNALYWYENPGGSTARNPNWQPHHIGDCNQGVEIATLDVGDRDIVLVASNEGAWSSGLVYFDPGNNPFGVWRKVSIDSSYRSVHQIACDTLNGIPFCTVGEQEQTSRACNAQGIDGLDDHLGAPGCRVAIYPWNGNGFESPTILSPRLCTGIEESGGRKKKNHLETLKMLL